MPTQQIKIVATDSVDFVKAIQDVVQRGATLKEGSFVYLNTMPFSAYECEFVVEIPMEDISREFTDKGPIVFATPLNKLSFIRTKEDLDNLDWDMFKSVCKSVGISGRDRGVMSTQYLKMVD